METRGDAAEKKLEEQWRECEAAFRAVFDMSPVALYLHRDGRFVRLNAAALGLFGAQDAAQLIGQSIFDRSPAGEGAAHRARIQEALDGTPEPRFTETRLLRLDGAEVDVEVLDRLVTYQGQPTLLASTHDIRERRQTEKALAEAFDLLELSGELAKVGGSRLRVATLRQVWTRQTFRMLDLEPGDTPDFEEGLAYYTAEARPVIRSAVQACIETGAPFDLELSAVTAKGRSIQVRTQGFAVRQEGKTVEVIRVFQDITDRLRREEQERQLEARLHETQKMESLGLLAGGIAHDINNVLASILALATVHRRKAVEGSPLGQDMEVITKACLRGGSLVQSLQTFARRGPRERRLLNLNDLARAVAGELEARAAAGIHLGLELDPDLPALDGEPAALSQALMALCVNALEAMAEGGSLRIWTLKDGPDGLLLGVEDSGAGMAPEVLRQAMTPFYSTKESSRNPGLGLAIVYRIVESHRGTIDLQSEPGRGTRVRLRFPVS